MITDMTLYLILTVLAITALLATVRSVSHDRPACPPRSHLTD